MKRTLFFISAAVLVLFVVISASRINAEESAFRKKFTANYEANAFQAQSMLVRQNKDIIPGEVELLIKEAMAVDNNYRERMRLLDLANAIATMHMHWNEGEEALVKKVEALQQAEIAKENEKIAAEERIKAVEKTPGNFILSTHAKEVSAKGLAPAVYPHWVHRSFFRCKVCHEALFAMKRGGNDISHKTMAEGKVCGACHNGKESFSASDEKNCTRCHLAGLPEAKPITDLSYYSKEKFDEIAKRVGSEWHAENLPNGKLPLDKFNFINWVKLDDLKGFKPLDANSGGTDTEGVRDTLIYFEPESTFMKAVVFSHKIHSTWVRCSLCHPKIFKEELGASRVKMIEMKDGKSCGLCHGRVSFTYSDCQRCHRWKTDKTDMPEGALVNKLVK